jgi:transposase, IS5 family
VSDQAAPEAGYTIASDRQSERQSPCKAGTVHHGEEFFQHKTPFDRSSLTRWRQRIGEEKLVALTQESLATATGTGAARQSATLDYLMNLNGAFHPGMPGVGDLDLVASFRTVRLLVRVVQSLTPPLRPFAHRIPKAT